MSVQLAIKAEVVDILNDIPKANDTFLVDTNVWYKMAYSRATSSVNQNTNYSDYLNKAISVDAHIHYCGLTLSELAHIIEKNEREIFEKVNQRQCSPKEYRHNFPNERINVTSELQAVWGQVKSMASAISVNIDDNTINESLKRFKNEKVDGYDIFMLECMKKHGIRNIITDDSDFATVSGIQVFTANGGVLAAARKQKKAIRR